MKINKTEYIKMNTDYRAIIKQNRAEACVGKANVHMAKWISPVDERLWICLALITLLPPPPLLTKLNGIVSGIVS